MSLDAESPNKEEIDASWFQLLAIDSVKGSLIC
jgi:hypothetical protein